LSGDVIQVLMSGKVSDEVSGNTSWTERWIARKIAVMWMANYG